MEELKITENTLPKIKMWNGQRVVTFKDIDFVHGRKNGTAKRNFNANKKHFIENEDYIKLSTSEIRTTKIMEISPKATKDVVFFTETGYLMIVKSFTDDLSWEVQRRLVNSYFRQKEAYIEQVVEQEPEVPLLEEKPKVPLVKSWYGRNNGRIKRLLNKTDITRKFLYHQILSRVGEKYDLTEANRLYGQATGHEPEHYMDVIEFFPELAEEADKYLDRMENVFFPR